MNNLSDWVYQVGVSKCAACRWCHAGTLRVPARGAGRLILVGPGGLSAGPGHAVVYARVWSADQS
jgi:predicted site-specific integrase-resolvase